MWTNELRSDLLFPSLEGWEETRETLSLYAKAVGAVPRALAEPHPKWWHISLEVRPEGLKTTEMQISRDLRVSLLLDLRAHALRIMGTGREEERLPLDQGTPATAFGDQILERLRAWGIRAEVERDRYQEAGQREYDREMAERYRGSLVAIDHVLEAHKSAIGGDTGPVQLWPHHFDLAFEWFGTKRVRHEEQGQIEELAAQINFGFAPGDATHAEPYFYSNPWPFDRGLLEIGLPAGAEWVTEGFEGSRMGYEQLAGAPGGPQRLLAYYQRVFQAASPSLMEPEGMT
jgi:hypothetical protein